VKHVFRKLNISYTGAANETELVTVANQNGKAAVYNMDIPKKQMPSLKGLALKDAVTVCENIGLKVAVRGKGKVAGQSLEAGSPIAKGQLINIELK
jgi:cell division protein FtsI (penicillin-binding protein 3)